MNTGDNRSPDEKRVSLVAGRAINQQERVVSACMAITSRYAESFMSILYPEDKGQAGDDRDSMEAGAVSHFTPVMPMLAPGEGTFAERFIEHFSEWLEKMLRLSACPENITEENLADGLSLLNETELEQTLAVTGLAEKLHQRFSDHLYCMEQRFSQLFPDAVLEMDFLPFGPENLCQAFQGLLEEVDLDLENRLYQFKRLDKVLMKTAGDYFHDINALLIAEGILPELRRKVVKSKDHERPAAGAVPEDEVPQSAAQHIPSHLPTGQADVQMYQAIQQLLALNGLPAIREAGQVSQGQAADSDIFSVTPNLLEQLTRLQEGQAFPVAQDTQGRVPLKEQISAVLVMNDGAGQGAALKQIDSDTIDVISMIFDLILDDRTLPDFVKALIGRLQIPILKAAIIDREFFKRKTHPARQLINKLAYAGAGWSEDSETIQDRLYEKMEYVVLRIVDEFDDDMHIFEELLEEFSAFIEDEKRQFELVQERIRQEALVKEEREKHKRTVIEIIMQKKKTEPVPGDIVDFLLTAWSQVVVEAAMAADGEGPGHERVLQFIDDLVWSLTPKQTPVQRSNLLSVLPGILNVMREGLEWIDYDEEKANTVFAALERYHVAVLKGVATEPPAELTITSAEGPVQESGNTPQEAIDDEIAQLNTEIDMLPDLDDDTYDLFEAMDREETTDSPGKFEQMMAEMGLTQEDDPGPRVEDEFTEQVRNLELGTWVELQNDDGRPLRVKLAWRGDQFTNFSFVNRHYKVVAERPFFVLADEFRQGTARQVDAPELFDRALDGVISGIMRVVN